MQSRKKALRIEPRPGMPPLTSLYLYISGSCNLACRHCWIEPDYQAGSRGGRFIKPAHVKKAIRQAKPLGLDSVKLTGGEPMLHPRFREIVDLIETEGIGMIMETNGTLIDGKMAAFLKSKKNFRFVSVSVDGVRAATHDTLRGAKGSFVKAIAGIRALVRAGFRPQLICTLHKGNAAEMAAVVEMAKSLGCGSVKFNHVQRLGRGDTFATKNGFQVKEMLELSRKIEEEVRPNSKIDICFDIPVAFSPVKRLLSGSAPQCRVLNILGILASGDISLCGVGMTVHELVFGNIGRDHLADVWSSSPKLQEMRRLIPEKFDGICGRCLHRQTCLGSCIANNYHFGKKFNAPYFFCREAEKEGVFPKSRTQ